MHKTLTAKGFLVFFVLAAPAIAVAQPRAALGPIEAVQDSHTSIRVLGQKFIVTSATMFAINGERIPAARAMQVIAVGQSAYVEASDSGAGAVATVVDISPEVYVPGSSSVYALGIIDAYSQATGVLRVGSLRIDSSSVAPDVLAKVRIGLPIEVAGIQPSLSGIVVGPLHLGIGRSVSQKPKIGDAGFRKQRIGGSGVLKQSIGGSGTQKQSIGGSGVQLQSIGGSGVLKQSIGGSGTQKQSIGGSGVQLQSIGGSGVLKQSIGGSGIQRQSIGGPGVLKQTIVGSVHL